MGSGRHGPEIRRRAAELIATGMSRSAVAAALGIDRGTLARWLKEDPVTVGRATEVEAAIEARVVGAITDLRGKALRALDELLDPGQEPKIRLGAALGVARYTEPPQTQRIEVVEADPLEAVERLLAGAGKGPHVAGEG